jgi:hypothetical protein
MGVIEILVDDEVDGSAITTVSLDIRYNFNTFTFNFVADTAFAIFLFRD